MRVCGIVSGLGDPSVFPAAVHLACQEPGTPIPVSELGVGTQGPLAVAVLAPPPGLPVEAFPPVPRPGLLPPIGDAPSRGPSAPCQVGHLPDPKTEGGNGAGAVSGLRDGDTLEGKPWLKWSSLKGWCVHLPFSRLSAAWIAWLLVAVGLVETISKRTVQRWLAAAHIKPWQFRSWITPKDLPSFLVRAKPVLDLYARGR